MPRKTQARLPLIDCDGPDCDSRIRQTRPSQSGLHFCKKKPCQAEKMRRYRKSIAPVVAPNEELLESNRTVSDMVLLFNDVLHAERVQCPECGLVDALPNWPHLNAQGTGCYGTGQRRLGMRAEVAKAIWPPVTRKYAND